MKMHHVGIVVENIEKAAKQLDFLGTVSEIYSDPIQKVKVAFIAHLDTNIPSIELIELIDEDSPVTNLLNRGVSIYHLCYSVKDLDEAINLIREKGVLTVGRPHAAVAFQNRRSLSLPKEIGL